MTGESLIQGSIVIFLASIFSKTLGLVRETLIAYFFGAQSLTDAFVVASVIPAAIAGLVGGALTTVFISVFVEERERLGEVQAWEGARAVLGASFLLLLGMLGLAYGLAPFFLQAIAPGFDPPRFELALQFSYIMLPGLVFWGFLGLLTGIFQAYSLFSIPAITGLFFNVCLISFLLIFSKSPLVALGVGTVAAVAIQVAILLLLAKRKWPPLAISFYPRHPTVLRVWKLFVPILIGSGIGYLNLIVDRVFASFLPVGAVAALNFAARIKELPVGLFGVAISQAIYPMFSLHAAQGGKTQLKNLLSHALETIWLFIIPASAGFMVLNRQTVAFLFERGAFVPTATQITAEALFFYSLGLVGSCSMDLVARVFYAQKDTRTPVSVATLGFLANILLNWAFIHPLAHKGLALATSISSILSALILTEALRRRLGGIEGKELVENLVKIGGATGVMVLAILPLRKMAEVWWGYLSVVLVGMVVYGVCVLVLRPRCVRVILELGQKEFRRRLPPGR